MQSLSLLIEISNTKTGCIEGLTNAANRASNTSKKSTVIGQNKRTKLHNNKATCHFGGRHNAYFQIDLQQSPSAMFGFVWLLCAPTARIHTNRNAFREPLGALRALAA